jgi:hypothetical protein
MSEKMEPVNISEKLQKFSDTLKEYKDAFVGQCQNMEVDVKKWNFAVGKMDGEYTVEVDVKLGIRNKPC